jgi:hypothetical protein
MSNANCHFGCPLIVGVCADKGGGTAVDLERRLGVVVRRVGLPVFPGLAALHTGLREIGSGVAASVLAILAAVVHAQAGGRRRGGPHRRFRAVEARAIRALVQCGGVMTLRSRSTCSTPASATHACVPTLMLIGLVSTIAVGPLLPRAPRPGAGVAPDRHDRRWARRCAAATSPTSDLRSVRRRRPLRRRAVLCKPSQSPLQV